MKKLITLIILILVILISGCQQGGTFNSSSTTKTLTTVTIPARPVVVERTIEITNSGFSPDSITVNGGELVLLTVESIEGDHSFILYDFGINLPMPTGRKETVQFTATIIGTFEFYCMNHPQMRGTLTVNQP